MCSNRLYSGGRGRGGQKPAGGVGEGSGQEADLPPAVHDLAMSVNAAGKCRAQELHVQIQGRREPARWQGRDQGRAQRVVQHRREEAALDHARRVEEAFIRLEGDLDRARLHDQDLLSIDSDRL